MTDNAMPSAHHPFFIISPPYTRTSAGIVALHILCHQLNSSGENAFIVHHPPQVEDGNLATRLQYCGEFPGGLNAPLITQNALDYYNHRKIFPIVIYPEIFDNPFNVPFFARYLLNYPGLLGRPPSQVAQYTFAYSRRVATEGGVADVLYIPTSDLAFWNAEGASPVRSGTCYYAGKLQAIFGKRPDRVPDGSIEIPRDLSMSREQIRQLFWAKEAFYCYEDTALATEAMLCGCPTVFVANEHFVGIPLAHSETTMDGACLIDELGGLDRARRTVGKCRQHISEAIEAIPRRVREIATRLRALAVDEAFVRPFAYPYEPRLVLFDANQPAPLEATRHSRWLSAFSRVLCRASR